MTTLVRSILSLTVAILLAGCVDYQPHVEGEIDLAHRDATASLLRLRIFPDHPDGFDPRRIYTGDREFASETIEIDAIEFPHAFDLVGHEEPDHNAKERWRALAWIGDEAEDTWIRPGQTFGTAAFTFEHEPHTAMHADGIVIELDAIAPPP